MPNAFLKVPMQFLILLTGVLVFVFFHFHPTPLLWNRAELARLEAKADPAALAPARAEAEEAHRARRVAAEGFAAARREGGDVARAREAYRLAQRRLDAAEAGARRLAETVSGAPVTDVNHIFPSYVVSQLRGGLACLVIAVIFAAAMSTLAAEFNSLATATMVDFYKRFVRPDGTAAHELLVSRAFTAFWGLFASAVALQAGRLGSAIEVVNRIGEAGSAVDVDMRYEEGAAGAHTPTVRNVVIDRLTVGKAAYTFFVRGLAGSPVRGLTVRDSAFRSVAKGSRLEHVEDLVLRNVTLEPAQ